MAGSGQVYAQRQCDAPASAARSNLKSPRGRNYCAATHFKGIYSEMRAYTGQQLSYLWSVRVIPIRTIIFSATGFRMPQINGSRSVSEIQDDFLALQ